MNDREDIIGLLGDVEACLKDSDSPVLLDLQKRAREAREKITKGDMSFVYCLDDEPYFNWENKAREEFKPLKLFQITLEIGLMAFENSNAQMHAKEMVDEYLDHRARLSQITNLVEVSKSKMEEE